MDLLSHGISRKLKGWASKTGETKGLYTARTRDNRASPTVLKDSVYKDSDDAAAVSADTMLYEPGSASWRPYLGAQAPAIVTGKDKEMTVAFSASGAIKPRVLSRIRFEGTRLSRC